MWIASRAFLEYEIMLDFLMKSSTLKGENPFDVMTKVKNAGAIFLGEYSSEPLGDYFAGPNHVLNLSHNIKGFLVTISICSDAISLATSTASW